MSTKGTMKVAQLVNDAGCADLITASLYSLKHMYFLSNFYSKVEQTRKERNVQSKGKGKKFDVSFLRLNLVIEYNYGMGNVDEVDQLQL